MNWKKTEEFYLKEGYRLPLPPESKEKYPAGTRIYYKKQEQLDVERWEMQVMERDVSTGDWVFRQKLGDPNKYPITRLVQLKRVRATDGKEYLKSFREMKGIDNNGNLRPITVQDPEIYMRPHFVKERRRSKTDPNVDELVIVDVTEDELVHDPNTVFSPELVDKYLEGQLARRVSLVVAEETEQGTVSPRQVTNLEDFKHKDFDELYAPIPTSATKTATRK